MKTVRPYGVVQAEARAVADGAAPRNASIRDVILAIREAERCNDCGKTRAVVNANAAAGLKGYREEKVDPALHCACIGGPAYHAPAEEQALDVELPRASSSDDELDDAPPVPLGAFEEFEAQMERIDLAGDCAEDR